MYKQCTQPRSLIFHCCLKGGYLDFSHLTELKIIYITEMYMKLQYKSSITKNHKIKKKHGFWWASLKRLRSLLSYF